MARGYDGKCEDLARHFLAEDKESPEKEGRVGELAQHIQDEVENWLIPGEAPLLAFDPKDKA